VDAGQVDADQVDRPAVSPLTVSQAFCSALPVAYNRIAPSRWKAFASLVLQAAYEATLWAVEHNAGRGASNIALLTGGAFGNDERWIYDAMERALKLGVGPGDRCQDRELRRPAPALLRMAEAFR
jgi:hypothetical protein